MVRRIIQLTEARDKELRERAKKEGISFAELARRSLDETLSRPLITDEMRERAKKAVGFAHGGPSDLSINHDKYWAEDIDRDRVH